MDSDLKAAVQFAVIHACLDPPDASSSSSAQLTPRALASLSELTCMFATTLLAPDLDAFRKHAAGGSAVRQTTTITVDDVLLTVRRNPELTHQLQAFHEQEQQQTTAAASKRNNKKQKKQPENPVVIEKQSMKTTTSKQDMTALDSDSSSSSDDDDFMSSKAAPTTKRTKSSSTAATANPSSTTNFRKPVYDSLSSDSDVPNAFSKKLKVTATSALRSSVLGSSSSSDDDDLQVSARRPKAPLVNNNKRRFRLSALKSHESASSPKSDVDDVLDHHPSPLQSTSSSHQHINGVSSRIQQTLDALGDDSAPSEGDDH
jgi:hypothetical protein